MACRLVGVKPLSEPNAGLLLIGQLGTYFIEIWIKIQQFLLRKIDLKISFGKSRPSFVNSVISQRQHGVSDHLQLECLYNRFRLTIKETSKLLITGPFEGYSLVDSPHKGSVTWKMFPCHGVSMHYVLFEISPHCIYPMAHPWGEFNSLAPGRFRWNFRYHFQANFNDWGLMYLLRNCVQMNVTGLYWW